jgi:hypothetical protein
MGDPLAMRAKYVLSKASYPGDQNPGTPQPDCFTVYRVSDEEHVVIDQEHRRDPEITVLASLLMNPRFKLANWYTRRLGMLRGLDPATIRRWGKNWGRKTLTMQMPLTM